MKVTFQLFHNNFFSKTNKQKLVLSPCSVNILKGGGRKIRSYATVLTSIFPVIEANEYSHPMSKGVQKGPGLC